MQATFPIESKAIRFAPARDEKPVSSFWRVWAEGSNVYAFSRTSARELHISVHESGQIHFRQGHKLKQDLTPLTQIGSGPWFHGFELRFLVSQGNLSPPNKPLKKKDKAYLISIPDEYYLCADLIIASPGTPLDYPLPVEFPGGQPIWRTQLKDPRPAVLVGRVLKLDDENRAHIRYFREELKPTVTFNAMPNSKYAELYNLHWSKGGNVVFIVPMGEEAFRSEQDDIPQVGATPTAPRSFQYKSPHSKVDLIAPNETWVAVIELAEADRPMELEKGIPKLVELGLVTIRIEPDNLIAGSSFKASPCKLVCSPSVGGTSLKAWEYMIRASFDGSTFTAEFLPLSTSLQNKNFAAPINGLDATEELVVAIPATTIKLTSTLDLPSASTELVGRFTLRNRS